MQLINVVGKKADIQFSIDELTTLNNSLNEVCNGINVIDFEQQIGTSREQAKLLLNAINNLASEMCPPRYVKDNSKTGTYNHNSSSKTIKKKCILETSEDQVAFFLRNLDYFKNSIGIIVVLTKNHTLEENSVKTSASRMKIETLQTLVSYLEDHIGNLKENHNKVADTYYYHIFQIQALSGNVISEDEGSFNLRFMVNVGNQKEKGDPSTYIGAEAAVTFANIRSFTSSLQAALNELSDCNSI